MKTWIVVVNRIEAKIFESDKKNKVDIRFVSKIENPRGRLKAHEIDADKPGVFGVTTLHGSGLERHQSPTDRIAQVFAKKVVLHLEQARQQGIEDFVIIAEPNFLGKMRALYPRELKGSISKEVSKDLGSSVTEDELRSRLSQPAAPLGF